ncbi:hypothetical protein FB554_2588 [Barrientosiimonas humi]|uniref:Methyltransferase family protein n=1 Tax=Barrientosiimonas humi TaxID=999931 RepID=A0A542XF25_9MICO|nr:class I SAM-dependent methyltransferase [Barrientosiimonas humi]TQL34418.1 hypothetical protein FB554_2588 [Barrientosiimonas humi]CAG7574408.1 hypothetical protein BH39T_PBIAJDOK_03058 [Barrientosiimonas humi]
MTSRRPVGVITRGTTNPNRLRRCDRWLVATQAHRLRGAARPPVVVDLGYGASPVTVLELARRLQPVRPDVEVVGIEISPERVAAGEPLARKGVGFRLGGFEVPLDGRDAQLIRAFNVLRQYDEGEVAAAWERLRGRLAPGGLLVDGTCDELGRIASWVALERSGPVSLTVSLHLGSLADPAVVAERLPKALIHRNVPGERVHDLVSDLSGAWRRASPLMAYGPRQRFLATVEALREQGWPVLHGPRRWRLGEVTVAWEAVAPAPYPA